MDHSARREAALRAAGIDPSIMAREVFTTDELKPDLPPPPPSNPHNLPDREPTRRFSDAEWGKIAHVLPDRVCAVFSQRRWLETMLEFVISGRSWTSIGGPNGGTMREKRRRERGRMKWVQAGNIAMQSFDDVAFAEQVYRTCQWITHGDISTIALRKGVGPSIRRWKVMAGSPTKPLT